MSDRSRIVVLALGSNVGDRHYELRRGVHRLREFVRISRISSVIETAPVDSPRGSGMFLNQVIAGTTKLTPAELLGKIHLIEQERWRRRIVRNAPRRLDIDIILFDAVRMRSRELTIPHPRFGEREFVLQPMREIGWGQTPSLQFTGNS